MRCVLPLLLGVAGLAPPASSYGQTGSTRPAFVVDQWTTDDGLPQNTVTSITQTRDGYIWVATWGGLARFDGMRFTLFTTQEHPQLGSDRVRVIAADTGGGLWVGTENGLAYFFKDSFTRFGTEQGLPDHLITALHVAGTGHLWIGTERGGLARYDGLRFRRYTSDDGVPGSHVYRIVEDADGSVWVDTDRGHARLAPADDRFTRPPREIATTTTGSLLAATRDGLWLGFDDAIAQWRSGWLGRHGIRDRFGNPVPRRAAWDRDGELWIAAGNGILRLRPRSRGVDRIALPDGRETFSAREIFVDREGTRWAGTDVEGLLRMRPRHFTVLTSADGLSTDNPTAVLEDKSGRLWIGSNCDRLNLLEQGRVRDFRTPSGEWIGCVWSLAEDRDGAIWMGSWGAGLARYADGRLSRYTRANGLRDSVVLSLYSDRSGTLWVGTNAGGLSRIERGQVVATYDTAAGLPSNSVRFITEDRSGRLWIGTLAGLSRRDGERFTTFTTRDGLAHDYVRAIYEDADATMWIGSYGGGLTRLKDGRFTAIRRGDGLFDDVVSAIVEDAEGNLWMTGNRGIFRASRASLNDFADGRAASVQSVPYGKGDGLISAETNGGFQPAAWRTADGRLWFPTIKGLAVVDPAIAARRSDAPSVMLEGVVIDGVSFATTDSMRVTPDARQIEIRYAGLQSSAPEHISFRYQLDGVDRDWVYVGPRRVAYYTRLAPGDYRFRVDAASREGRWSAAPASMRFTVLPPFWMTWWFRLIAVALAFAAGWGVIGTRMARLRAAQATQLEFTRRLIASQEAERKRIAAELHDSVGQDLLVVKNRAMIALQAPEGGGKAAREQLQQIAEIVSDAIRDTRVIAYNLRPVQLDRIGLAATIRSAVAKATEGAGIRVAVDVDETDGLPADTSINVFRIVQEGVNNILKHSRATEASILVRRDGPDLRVVIADNGRGISAPGDGTGGGLGLTGILERVRALGGRHELETAPGAGTAHRIVIPLTGAHG